MKKSIFILVTLVLSLTSCLQQETISTGDGTTTIVTSDNNTNGGNGNTTGSTGTTGTTGSTNGSTGTTGSTGGTPPHEYEIMMAGGQAWYPGVNHNSNVYGYFFDDALQSSFFFSSDSRLKVRFKPMTQPTVPAGQEFCQGRQTGQAGDTFKYTKLKFYVHLRDVICSSYNQNDQCTNAYLGNRYRSKTIGPVDVGTFSPVFDYSYQRNIGSNIIATTVEIDQVRADSACQYNGGTGYTCPSEIKVRDASCWNMTMQVSTDFTSDF